MEYDSESSCEGHLRDLKAIEEPSKLREQHKSDQASHLSTSLPQHSLKDIPKQPNLSFHEANKSLSAQVMEYYKKYSHSSNLDQYFSLPTSSIPPESVKYYYSIYELNSKLGNSRQDCIGEEYNLQAYVPRERRRWVRPPLIGQSSSADNSTLYIQPLTNPQSLSPVLKNITSETNPETKNESQEVLPEGTERKIPSPTSSVASHKPLEWDSGADVGYFNSLPHNKHINKKLSTIERMALARGCSAALRLDPEGTTESGVVGKGTTMQLSPRSLKPPKASSTLITENISESESEIEITPIMKNMLPGIITGSDIKSEEKNSPRMSKLKSLKGQKDKDQNMTLSRSSFTFKIPSLKCPMEGKKVISNKQNINNEYLGSTNASLLKKSTSMNTIAASTSKILLKRSQSELNLHAKDKSKMTLPLIFNSTSSISTVVNKPTTCDKVIQTSLNTFSQESVGIQVSVQEEEKPPLPKRGTSLQKSLHSILKNPKSTYKVQNCKKNTNDKKNDVSCIREGRRNKIYHSSSDISPNESTPITPQPDNTENITGRANSFEYFPGHIYENVPNGSSSHVSSIDTGESNSTFPNTSSSLSEKLWGDSDSLVRDLERSVHILKSLIDANKCDKQVKKRLIHHVVKRLVTAKYIEDKIEHNLEDNVPWNPDDARKKVYETDILHALTKKHSTTTSSDNWKMSTKSYIPKAMKHDREILMQETLASSNSDKFDRNKDRTEMDGRKARMGLRADDCQQSSNTPTEPDRSESSECFVPQQSHKGNKMKNAFSLQEKCKILQQNESTSTNSSPPDHNRILLDAAVANRKTSTTSSKNSENNTDWRFPTTLSERQFELKRCRSSNPEDLRLVNYAEMEKRNQLVWITNEINHLCNLKKLLEQPRRLERAKSSPRKVKSASFKTKPLRVMTHMQEAAVDTDSIYRDVSNSKGNSVAEQWSSHCNLATCHSTDTGYINDIQRTKKRNSSSQTATESIHAHSKTGGEIVTTSKAQNPNRLINTGVQTTYQETSTVPLYTQNGTTQCTKCSIRKTLIHSPNKCNYVSQGRQYDKDTLQAIPNTCLYCSQSQLQNSTTKNRCHHILRDFDFPKEGSEAATELTQSSYANSNSVNSSKQTHCYPDKSKNQLKQKETKNQINASKSKCTCNCQSTFMSHCNNCKCGINNVNKKMAYQNILPETCQIHTKQIPAVEIAGTTTFCESCYTRTCNAHKYSCMCQKPKDTVESTSMTINECACRNEVNSEVETNMFTMVSGRNCLQDSRYVTDCNNQQKIVNLCGCSADCSCENKLESEICMPNGSHEIRSNLKTESNRRYRSNSCSKADQHQIHTRPYYLVNTEENETSLQPKVQTRIKCNCNKDCSCPNKVKEVNGNDHRTKYDMESNNTNGLNTNDSNKSCKYCRMCGKMYQNTRKCNCHQTYPKSVAYEISFTKENSQKNISTIKKMPLSNTSNNAVRSDKCTCTTKKQKENSKNDKKTSLQDYLSKNKPEFVSNAETRKQYVSDIAQLRQLRKEKRIQLLAMASTSNSNKFPKSSKPTVNLQKRISDEEMKERLRKRYRRLNEVRVKRQQQERQEEVRRNKLMAKIFGKKLQQKVLRGQVDLSQSVSVISNL